MFIQHVAGPLGHSAARPPIRPQAEDGLKLPQTPWFGSFCAASCAESDGDDEKCLLLLLPG
eukprot:5885279-Alexandrium_andersonii.AAC.1